MQTFTHCYYDYYEDVLDDDEYADIEADKSEWTEEDEPVSLKTYMLSERDFF